MRMRVFANNEALKFLSLLKDRLFFPDFVIKYYISLILFSQVVILHLLPSHKSSILWVSASMKISSFGLIQCEVLLNEPASLMVPTAQSY